MVKKLCALLALIASPALAAVETTTVNGTVYDPSATGATGGKIVCTLSSPGSASNGSTLQRVAGKYQATIQSDGSVNFTLVPNDVITPAGTYYSCEITVFTNPRATWTETWNVATAPDPIAIGSISRTDIPNTLVAGNCINTDADSKCEVTSNATSTVTMDPDDDGTANYTFIASTPTANYCLAQNAGNTGLTYVACGAVAGSSGQMQYNASGTMGGAPGMVMTNSGTALTCSSAANDLDGDGTAASADWNGDGTVDETGLAITGALSVSSKILSPAASGSADPDGTGSISAWTANTTLVSSVVQTIAHAAQFGDEAYRYPAVFDAYDDVFLGRPLYADCDADGTAGGACAVLDKTALVSQCASNDCTTDNKYICITTSDTNHNGKSDVDNDGKSDFEVGDLFAFATSADTTTGNRVYYISAIADGSGGICPVGTDNGWTVAPYIDYNTVDGPDRDANGTVDSGMRVARIWGNTDHPSHAGAYHIGYTLGYGPRLRDGLQGPNLLTNGEVDFPTSLTDGQVTIPGWTVTAGAQYRLAWSSTPPTSPADRFKCMEGATTYACAYQSNATVGNYIESTTTVNVTPGDRYVLSGFWAAAHGLDYYGLSDDRDGDGTWTQGAEMKQSNVGQDVFNNFEAFQLSPFWAAWEVPEGVHQVRARFTRGGSIDSSPMLDGISLRRTSVMSLDAWQLDKTKGSAFLINDPGQRLILITGDSWARGSGSPDYGTYIKNGLVAALAARFTRQNSAAWAAQVILSGVGGYKAVDVLNNFNSMVTKYEPAYVIVIIGTNDIESGPTATATFVSQVREIAHRIQSIGAVPIFISPAPIGPAAGTTMTTAHNLAFGERRALLNAAP